MAETQTKSIKGQDAEKAQEKKGRLEPAPVPMKALADESAPFPELLGTSAMELPIEKHAALLGDPRFSHSANSTQKTHMVTELQGTYGNAYVQRVVGLIQAKKDENLPEEEPDLASIARRIMAEKGSGQPLESKTLPGMGTTFNRDFGDVPIHTDNTTHKLAEKVNAKAFTTGKDIFCKESASDLGSESGKKLFGHELTDVVQPDAVSIYREPAKQVEEDEGEEELSASRNKPNPQGGALEHEQVRQLSEPYQRQIDWSSNAVPQEAASIEYRWSTASSQAGKKISWAASETAQTIAEPQQISWGTSKELASVGVIPCVINASKPTALDPIQATWGKNTWAVAPFPTGFKAPDFEFNATEKKKKGGKSEWFVKPTLKEKAFQGNSQPLHPAPGLYKQPQAEPASKVPVFVNISASMSRVLGAAENEHARDYKWAYTISLKRAQYALTKRIIGRSFGPKLTKGDAEQAALDRLKRYIHRNTGADKTKWADMYKTLYLKTLERDNKGWHTLPYGNRREIKDTKGVVIKVIYDVVRGPTTKIGSVPPAQIIKY